MNENDCYSQSINFILGDKCEDIPNYCSEDRKEFRLAVDNWMEEKNLIRIEVRFHSFDEFPISFSSDKLRCIASIKLSETMSHAIVVDIDNSKYHEIGVECVFNTNDDPIDWDNIELLEIITTRPTL